MPITRPSAETAPSGASSTIADGRAQSGPWVLAEMDFVGLEAAPLPQNERALDCAPIFFRRHHRLDVEQAKPFDLSAGPSMPSGSRRLPEHLIAAANAEHTAAAATMRRRVEVPALRAQKSARSAIVDLEPGRMTSAASPGSGSPGRTKTSSTSGSGLQRIEIVEIGDARQHRHGDLRAAAAPARQPLERRAHPPPAVARRLGSQGTTPKHAPAGAAFDRAHAVVEQRRIAAKLVDDEAAISARIFGIEHACVPTRLRDDAAAIDVADEHHRARPPPRAKPILAMSPARRLISAGLPAPSTMTRSHPSRGAAKLSSTAASSCGFSRW